MNLFLLKWYVKHFFVDFSGFNTTNEAIVSFTFSRFTCPKIAVHFTGSFQTVLFFLTQAEKSFHPVKSCYFCVRQQKKELFKKNQ